MGGEALKTIAKEVSIQPTELEVNSFLTMKQLSTGKRLAVGFAVLTAAPLPFDPLTSSKGGIGNPEE
jgi:hypothetical protein